MSTKYLPATILGLKTKLATKSDTAADLMGLTSWVSVGETDKKISKFLICHRVIKVVNNIKGR